MRSFPVSGAFDPERTSDLSAAFETAWGILLSTGITPGEAASTRETLAKAIIVAGKNHHIKNARDLAQLALTINRACRMWTPAASNDQKSV